MVSSCRKQATLFKETNLNDELDQETKFLFMVENYFVFKNLCILFYLLTFCNVWDYCIQFFYNLQKRARYCSDFFIRFNTYRVTHFRDDQKLLKSNEFLGEVHKS